MNWQRERVARLIDEVLDHPAVRDALLACHEGYQDGMSIYRNGLIRHYIGLLDAADGLDADDPEIEGRLRLDPHRGEQFELAMLGRHRDVLEDYDTEVRAVVRAYVIGRLPRPRSLTTRDVLSILNSKFLVEGQDFDASIDRLRKALKRRSGVKRRSAAFLVALGDEGLSLPGQRATLWSNDWMTLNLDRVDVSELWRLTNGERPRASKRMRIFAGIVGYGSRPAMLHAAREAQGLIRTALWMVSDLCRAAASGRRERVPRLTGKDLIDHSAFLSQVIGIYFGSADNTEPVNRPLRNAVELMIHASRQSNDALALAMGCASLEAVLCAGGPVTKTLCDNVATLLEPDPTYRPQAMRLVRNLYRVRSNTLHGASMNAEESDCATVRALGAHVVRAVIEWRDITRRMGGRATALGLHAALDEARLAGRQFAVSPAPAVRELWLHVQ